MVDFKNILRGSSARLALAAVVVVLAGSVATQSLAQSRDARIAERLQPAGSVCLAGEPCAGGAAGAASAAGAGSSGSPAAAAAGSAVAAAGFNAEQTYQQSCAMCHNAGVAGAPKLGDAEWTRRLEAKGRDTIIQNAINGLNAMPARGMCMTCSDENIAALVDYLVGSVQ
ncbi:MAG: c-type cytochrome [Pseudomonadales bacterium]|nr:c-type cytochrome [Pseudomonadales bacterium]